MTVVAQLLGAAFSHVEQGVELREAGGLLFQLAFVGKRFGGLGARSLHLPAGFFEARAALVSLRAHLGDGVVQPRHGACRITAQLAFVLGFADDAHLERRAHAVERQLQGEPPVRPERHGPRLGHLAARREHRLACRRTLPEGGAAHFHRKCLLRRRRVRPCLRDIGLQRFEARRQRRHALRVVLGGLVLQRVLLR